MGNPAMFLCPWHNEKTPSLAIDFVKNHAHCFGCGKSATVGEVIQEFVVTGRTARVSVDVCEAASQSAGEWLVEVTEDLVDRTAVHLGLQRCNREVVPDILRGMLDEYDTLVEFYENRKRG
jgi:hypothetical protein